MSFRIRHTALALLLAGSAHAATLADWASASVPVKPGDTPDIVAFALPLANAFDELAHCAPGLEVRGEASGDAIVVDVDSKNGFARCENSDDGHVSEFAYWKRANGHYLVGMAVTWNDVSWEGDEMKNEVFFYDFDPKAAAPALKPEESVSRAVNAFREKDYFILLPQSGTHLVLQPFESAGGATHYLAWDGERFADKPVTSLPQADKPADKGNAKKAAPAKAKADDKGKAKDKPRDKPEKVYAIGQAYRDGKQLAEKDATRLFLDIRNVWHTSPETTRKIEYLFAEDSKAPYLIYVHHEGMGTLFYEEYLADKDGGLLFWFQKLEDDSGKWEYRFYFDGDKVVYYDIRKDGGKPQTGTGLPKKHSFGTGEGDLSMQRSFQALMSVFAAAMPTD